MYFRIREKVKEMMKKNRRGISSIIATLILVLLTVVLIGVVWVVVNGIVSNSTKQASSGAQCFNSGVEVTYAACNYAGTSCNTTVQRTTGTDVLGGVAVVFKNAGGNSNLTYIDGNINTLASVSIPAPGFNTVSVTNVTEVDAAIYFKDASGNKQVCQGYTPFTSVQLTP
ncbi:MAG: hypothetical protein M1165_02025 [Candidatus Pacearchaeota archaeon]|nr:hypothetical protein [Candidatus Pacearchaeota archaeon]